MFKRGNILGSKIVHVTDTGNPLVVHVGNLDGGKSSLMSKTERLPVHQVLKDLTEAKLANDALQSHEPKSRREKDVRQISQFRYDIATRRAGQAVKAVLASLMTEATDVYGLPESELDVVLLQLLEENGGATAKASRRAVDEKTTRARMAKMFLVAPITGELEN
jgi:hypothetical protein